VLLEIEGLKHGAATALFVKRGFLSLLEMYSYGEAWPADPVLRDVKYRYAERRVHVRDVGD
jgi:hypothetical protein